IQDRIVMVTGASSGIGASCAKMFAQEGAAVILAARRLEKLQALASEIEKACQCKVYSRRNFQKGSWTFTINL
ncbi:MAG: SDR family NAD(P)-dependent oxidoreductase, partial [Cyanobacteriota bacterium]|nr:SDR family NAD(P)-dependent oxidoreductase [Cyanobacteriota bacterium]